jgi:hypothetical protein
MPLGLNTFKVVVVLAGCYADVYPIEMLMDEGTFGHHRGNCQSLM